MLLRDGITGFSNKKAILPSMSRNEFKRICFEVAITLKFKIENFDFKLDGKNFYYAEIKFNNNTMYILLNAYHPFVAFASEMTIYNNKYIEDEGLKMEFGKVYEILAVSELESPISNKEKGHLNNEELKQLKYYTPNNLSEIIFNYWD